MIQEPETLYKLMVLYMLKEVNFPLTNSQLSQFFLDKEYTTYFTLQQVLSELMDSKLISARRSGSSTRYEITSDGMETLSFFGSDIGAAAVLKEGKKTGRIVLKKDSSLDSIPGQYRIRTDGRIEISASSAEGIFYGIQSLRQMMRPVSPS